MQHLLNEFRSFARGRGLNGSCFIVGGTVRDMLLGLRTPRDIDIALKGNALKRAKDFARASGGTFVLLDEKFGMARVVKGGEYIDFSKLRGKDIEEDLHARDMTINAMAMPLFSRRLIDPLGGYEDLMKGLVRAVSEKNLVDDPLRVLRCYRFSAMPGFRLEKGTTRILRKLAPLLKTKKPAPERITQEMRQVLLFPHAGRVADRMARDGVLKAIMPGVRARNIRSLKALEGIFSGRFPFRREMGQLTDDELFSLKLAVLSAGAGESVSGRLSLSGSQRELIEKTASFRKRLVSLFKRKKPGGLTAVRVLRDARDGIYIYLLASYAALKPGLEDNGRELADFSREILSAYLKGIRPKLGVRLITGDDLIRELGLKPSPLFKTVLGEVELLWLAGRIKDRAQALAAAKKLSGRLLKKSL
ncbi:MAG: hypothetical protein M0Z59_05525 [Nitrospiraceae bacterium]|nr:hypothetical protein [Nitrospiraceae bacterium]